MNSLIQKYNIPGPRYTSYPTVPFWDATTFSKELWENAFIQRFYASNQNEGISLYIHLPFCESLCTFCACHKHITKRHEVEQDYIDTVLKEWQLYLDLVKEKPIIKELHLGGGTPTFFSAEHLEKLILGLFQSADKHVDFEFSFEGHPNHTSKEQLQVLFDLGFTRVSFGVQDYNEKVQQAIHRVQPFENVKQVTDWARKIGYTSVSHDIIFGLPHQTKANIIDTIQKTKALLPDRISFYSYAHVPWIKGVGQRGFDEVDLPKDDEKRALYEIGKQLFAELGYEEIGMDHFALKRDSLYQATEKQTLHRNFMGYTSNKTEVMIGLGMSAISDSWTAFAQNVKTVKEYQTLVNQGQIPVFRGHILSNEDQVIRKHILNIMCHFKTDWSKETEKIAAIDKHLDLLKELEADGLVQISENGLKVLEHAKPFVRNVCMAFDKKLIDQQSEKQRFSMTI